MPGGRPPTRNAEQIRACQDEICARLAEGQSLVKICDDPELPCWTEAKRWIRENPEFASKYARAKADGIERLFEQRIMSLEHETPERGPDGKIDPGWVQWRKLQVDAEKWGLAKLEPKKYGEKLDVDMTGTVNVILSGQDKEL